MRFKTLKELAGVLVSPPIDHKEQSRRIKFMEQNVALPVKAILFAIVFYFMFLSGEFEGVRNIGDGGFPIESIKSVLIGYLAINLAASYFLFAHKKYSVRFIQWVVFGTNLMDALILALCTMMTGGLNTYAYWVFIALIVRNSISIPDGPMQIGLNLLLMVCYAGAAFVDKTSIDFEIQRTFELDDTFLQSRNLTGGYSYQPYMIRIFLMMLLMACCYGLQILFERQRQTDEDFREHLLRQEQLQSAGRLAAEIAHQIKNPLAIITNAAFSLQKIITDKKPGGDRQLQIIRDEVERADRIITELMGYAQLAEGKIEKLDVASEIDEAVKSVFPPGTHEGLEVIQDVDAGLYPLQMQRKHLHEVFTNLLSNARDALGGKGNIKIIARNLRDYMVVITMEDDGPGIPAEKVVKIFEPYFTTKEKGSGLGLAIVKHNVEIYGGSISVESEIGHGAKFILNLPARTMMRINR